MTEADWQKRATQPDAMLGSYAKHGGRASSRKLQLIACAVCRLLWDEIPRVGRDAVEAAERLADGEIESANYQELATAARHEIGWIQLAEHRRSHAPQDRRERDSWVWHERRGHVLSALLGLLAADTRDGARTAIQWVSWAAYRSPTPAVPKQARSAADARMCDLIREVLGSPFRRYEFRPAFAGGGVLLPDGSVFHVSDTARRIADGAAADLAFDRLPVLADALDDLGCPDAELVAHLRHGTGHVRGCWALDVVLGRS